MSSKIVEDKYKEKHKSKALRICISHMEMIHRIPKYIEVVITLNFIKDSIFLFKLRGGIRVYSYTGAEDSEHVIYAVDNFWRLLDIDIYRLQLTINF